MTGQQLYRKMIEVYGADCIKRVAGDLEVDKSTVYRWINAKGRVPGIVASWIDMRIAAQKSSKANVA